MRLSDHDLLQLTEEELPDLPEEVLRRLSVKLLHDLNEARERLKQTSRNSSRPPSGDLPWDKAGSNDEDQRRQHQGQDKLAGEDDPALDTEEASKIGSGESTQDEADVIQQARWLEDEATTRRKAGKQPRVLGYGRGQKLVVTVEEHYFRADCVRCDRELKPGCRESLYRI